MGFTLKVEGNTTIELGTTSITGVKVSTDIPAGQQRQIHRSGQHDHCYGKDSDRRGRRSV